jgi:hypothetical protein
MSDADGTRQSLTISEWWRCLRHRWPAIRSILKDGTVIYRATIIDGVVVLNRHNSYVMDSTIVRSDRPA